MTLCPSHFPIWVWNPCRFCNFALSAGFFYYYYLGVTLCWLKWIIKPQEKQKLGRGPWSWGLWSCLGQALLMAGPATLGQSKPDHVPEERFHSFSGLVFQCLTSFMGNRFSLQFNWHFSSSTLCPLPSEQTLRGAWLHLCSGICLCWAWSGSWWTISRAKIVWSPLWIAPVLVYGGGTQTNDMF